MPDIPPLFTTEVLATLLALDDGAQAEVSLDLGRETVTVARDAGALRLAGDDTPTWSRDMLGESGLRDDRVYRIGADGLEPVEVRAQRYARLMPTVDAPALVIDGISMHIARKDSPWRTTQRMARAVRPPGKAIFDCCGGLGYVAIHCATLGAREVVSVERSPEVLRLRESNPWSAGLSDERIRVVIGDVRKVVKDQADASFRGVVHDPPRITRSTGDLYGRPFYRELYRILAPGGWLLHYVGRPGITRGKLHTAGVPDRLDEVGFTERREIDDIQSILVRKPKR